MAETPTSPLIKLKQKIFPTALFAGSSNTDIKVIRKDLRTKIKKGLNAKLYLIRFIK